MRRSIIAYYILIAGCALCAGQDAAIAERDQAFVRAVDARDDQALERLLDEDLTWTDLNGNTRTKSEVIQTIPNIIISENEQPLLKLYRYGDLSDIQVNRGRLHALRVWVKRPDAWKLIVYQEVMSLAAPPTATPGAGNDCENPCKMIPYKPKNATEQQIAAAYSKLETAAMARNSTVFSAVIADEFVAVSDNSNRTFTKRERMQGFDQGRMGGVAPTPLVSAQMFEFGDAVLMRSEHVPDRGKPLHVTRVWVKRDGRWMETLSYQTSVTRP